MKPDEIIDIVKPVPDRWTGVGAAFTRLHTEYKKHGSLHIGYDFDGTVHDYHKVGDTYPQVIKLLQELKEVGCKCYCWTAYEDLDYVKKYLAANNIPCDGINEGGIKLPWESKKPFFSALLDDRAGLREVMMMLQMLVTNIRIDRMKERDKPKTELV